MDVRFINPFIASIKSVFGTMVNTQVVVGKPRVGNDTETTADVSGVIGFSGDATGCVVLSFPTDVACKVASAFAGVTMGADHPDFSDAIGELANMVAGNAKKDFAGLRASISLPSVIIGRGHVVSQSRSWPRLVIPCETSLGAFFVEVGMVVEKQAAVAASAPAAAAR